MNHSHEHRGKKLPHISASCVLERDGRFLLVEEFADDDIVINQPSGHVDDREYATEACIREVLEETGWHICPTHIIGIYYYFSERSETTYQRICFTGELISEEPNAKLDKVIKQVLWLTPDELLAKKAKWRSPLVMRCIDDYQKGRRYPLDIITNLIL